MVFFLHVHVHTFFQFLCYLVDMLFTYIFKVYNSDLGYIDECYTIGICAVCYI